MADKKLITMLEEKTYEYRKVILELCHKRGGLHIGGDYSCAEILVTLYNHTLNIDPKNPCWEDRDRFLLSKGHGGAGWYCVMAQRGYFDMTELMTTYKGHETRFGAHPCKNVYKDLDSSTGSLGHGMPIANGLALSARMDGKKYRVFCLVGDGELLEGSNWEAAAVAAALKLGNITVIVDRNRLSLDGFTEEIVPLDPLADKWRAFNWNVIEIDGHNIEEVVDTLDNLPPVDSKVPTVVIANTVKGKGVSFMENVPIFHHSKVTDEQYEKALAELEKNYGKGAAKA
ncbi:MAG: transketolase [Lutisporaceae bacterium]|jgi:transketolase